MDTGDRLWEKWDDQGVAAAIDEYWIKDPSSYEHAVRRVYAKLVREYSESPDQRILEVGCGSGLVYAELVPNVVSNSKYTGVDNSTAMLAIAHRRNPEGCFLQGDAFNLGFQSRSVDLVVSFEVLVHLPDIVRPISEMIRVSSHCMIFTVWVSGTGRTERGTDTLNGRGFLRNQYSVDDVLQAIDEAAKGSRVSREIRVVAPSTWAFVVQREMRRAARSRATPRIRPSPGLVEELRQELASRAEALESLRESLGAKQTELDKTKQELAVQKTRIDSLTGNLASQLRDREELTQDLAARAMRIERLAGALASLKAEEESLRAHAMQLALKHDEMRAQRLFHLVSRFRPRDDLTLPLPPSLDRIREENSPPGSRSRRFHLQHTQSLHSGAVLRYRLATSNPGLRGIHLAVIPDLPGTSGSIAVKLSTSENQTLAIVECPLSKIDPSSPTLFAFLDLAKTPAGVFHIEILVRGADSPIRLLQWQRYRLGGLGPLETRAFCACVYDP